MLTERKWKVSDIDTAEAMAAVYFAHPPRGEPASVYDMLRLIRGLGVIFPNAAYLALELAVMDAEAAVPERKEEG